MRMTRRLYGVLDRRLATRESRRVKRLIGRRLAILGWPGAQRHKVSFSDFPHVGRWYDALMAHRRQAAAWKRADEDSRMSLPGLTRQSIFFAQLHFASSHQNDGSSRG